MAPYSSWAAKDIRIDLKSLSAREAGRLEIAVCPEPTGGELAHVYPPIVIDATGFPEMMHGLGARILSSIPSGAATNLVVSTNGAVPATLPDTAVTTIIAWPGEIETLSALCGAAQRAGRWGIAIPILHPVTTNLDLLDELTATAQRYSASYCAAIPIETEPSARKILAREGRPLSGEEYESLFQDDPETIVVATERHVAAIASDLGILDSIPIPGSPKRSNWEAATALARAGTRMIRMRKNLDFGWEIIRSSAVVAQLDTPLTAIAASARLSIIKPLHELATVALEQWLDDGTAELFDDVDDDWRLRRR